MQNPTREEAKPETVERRKFARQPTGREIVIWLTAQESVAATVIDQGEGGIGVVIEACEAPNPDSQLIVEYEGIKRLATVASVRDSDAHEQIRLGLAWGL